MVGSEDRLGYAIIMSQAILWVHCKCDHKMTSTLLKQDISSSFHILHMTWCTLCNKYYPCFKHDSMWPVKNTLSSLLSLPATVAALQIQGGEPFGSYECAQCDTWDTRKQSFLLTSFSFLYSRHNTTSWWSISRASFCWSWPAVIFVPSSTVLMTLFYCLSWFQKSCSYLTSLVVPAVPHQPQS
jgi:hypothetical protein